MTLKDRQWQCSSCNAIHDRDFNVAVNIAMEGARNTLSNSVTGDQISLEVVLKNIVASRICEGGKSLMLC